MSKKCYDNKKLLEYAREVLEYDEKIKPYGLPYLITSKIADVAPEVMFMLLYRIMVMKDRFEFGSDLHRKMIGMGTLFMWLGKGEKQRDHSKLLANIWPCVKNLRQELFWSSSTVQRATLNEILVRFPSKDENNLLYSEKLTLKSNSDVSTQFKQTKCGLFLKKMLFNKDLILYAQRHFLSGFFKEKQYMKQHANNFFEEVYEVVKLIPRGKVTSYGAIAAYLGTKGSARMVGWAMNNVHNAAEIPAHRVVNRQGLLTGKGHFQRPMEMQELLEAEGLEIKNDQVINFGENFWDPALHLI